MQITAVQDDEFRKHIPALDGVRGCAAMSIFVFHYGGGAQSSFWALHTVGYLLHYGWLGVSLFFVLSGYLISGILWDGYQRPGWWKRFYIRRSLRIFPLYYLAILLVAITCVVMGVSASRMNELWSYIFYLRDIPVAFNGNSPGLPPSIELIHFWSLAVEEQFYLVWPFVLAWFAGKRARAKYMILILWLTSLAFRAVMVGVHGPEWGSHFLFGRAGELLAGAYLAMAIRGDLEERRRLFRLLPYIFVSFSLLTILLAFLLPSYEISSPGWCIAGLALCSVAFASMIGLCLRKGWVQSFFQFPLLRWLGKISYGIYVYHLLLRHVFIWLTQRLAPNLGYDARLALLFVVALIGTLAVASLSFYTYENAFLRLKERFAC